MILSELQSKIESAETKINQEIGARDALNARIEEISSEIKNLDEQIVSTEKAVWLLQNYAENQQKVLTTRIEGIVTRGLRAVFQNPTLEFRLTYSQTKTGEMKKTPEVAMTVWHEHDGVLVEGNIKNSFGGGLSVVAAVLLRIVITLHLNPRVDPVIILDEPLKDLSPAYDGSDQLASEYRNRMADFLRSLVDETDLQLIFVSHEPEYAKVSDVNHFFVGGIGRETTIKTKNREIYSELED